jgi:membrane protein
LDGRRGYGGEVSSFLPILGVRPCNQNQSESQPTDIESKVEIDIPGALPYHARVRLLIAAARKFFQINGLFLASGLAFDTILCCIPFFFVIIAIMGYVLSSSAGAMEGVQTLLQRFVPESYDLFTENLPGIIAKRNLYSLVGLGFFAFSSSVAFGSVRSVLDTVFEVKRPINFFLGKGVDLLLMVAVSGLFLLVVGIESALAVARGMSDNVPLVGHWLAPGWNLLSHAVGFGLTWTLLYLIFRFCPSRRLGRRPLLIACLICSVLLEFSKWFFAWYVARVKLYAILTGALGGIFFFLLWAYYASMAFIISATIASVVKRSR